MCYSSIVGGAAGPLAPLVVASVVDTQKGPKDSKIRKYRQGQGP